MKPIIFLLPIIALTLGAILYVLSLKAATEKKVFKRFIFNVGIIAFVLNLVWELIQTPLYKDGSYSISHITFCALGSVADSIMVLLLYLVLALIFRNPFWVQHVKWQMITLVILTGGIGAILSERRHISIGSWAYADSMPIIPFLNVGLSPVLQFMILPLSTYLLSLKMMRQKNKHINTSIIHHSI